MKKFFKKLDLTSKLIISGLLIVICIVIFQQYSVVKQIAVNSNGTVLREPSDFNLGVADWNFGNGFKERLLVDDTMLIYLKAPITKENFEKLVFELNPKDEISVELSDPKTIRIKYKNLMKLNKNLNTLLILLDNKLVYTITYSNTTYDEKFFQELNNSRVSSEN